MTAVTAGVDRFMRSAVNIESSKTNEMKVENVVQHRFDPDKGESPATILPAVIRQYPDVYIVPDLVDGQAAQILSTEVSDEERLVVAAIGAKEASEALLRVLMLKVPIKAFAPVVSAVVCGRLVRKLCNDCKQAFAPPPQLLQQLRLPADKVSQLYRQYQPPPLEPGKKPPPPCATCNGIGYLGRTGVFELLIVNDDVRAALMKQPSLEGVREAAKKAGMHSFQDEAIALVVQGVTSLEEVMRVLKEKE
jgi:type II secretory ATPase GspE/PulE/Tfp pilus assembly ATPase PilB-like protein